MLIKSPCRISERRQAGDTIVEVLIAISIVSLVLTSAYMVTNKNTQTMQAVQEKTQAQKLVERQIELLRAADNVPVGQCFMSDSGDVSTSPNTECVFNSEGQSDSGSGGVLYHMLISAASDPDTYAISANWDRIGGGTGKITMYYYEQK